MRNTKSMPLADRIAGMLRKSGRHYTPTGLAGILKIHPTVAATQLGKLVGKGLATYETDETGKRHYFYNGNANTASYTSVGGAAEQPGTLTNNTPMTEETTEEESLPTWRPLNGLESEKIKSLARNGRVNGEFTGNRRGVKVFYLRDNNFTVALVRTGGNLFVGESKRNPMDQEDEDIGRITAFSRAVRNQPVSI
jgi:hypothetical protein